MASYQRSRALLTTLAVAALSAGIAWTAMAVRNAARGQDGPVGSPLREAPQAGNEPIPARVRAEDLSQAFRNAARRVLPTVVVIKSPGEPTCPQCGQVHAGAPSEDGADPRHPSGDGLRVIGSGFLVDASGIVMTNQHVVQGSRHLIVQLADRRQFRVTRIKVDRTMDVAVLQLDSKVALPAAAFGDSEATEIGDWVLAIGCPLELEQTVSAGIISAKNRSFCPNHRVRMLQTDAAINPGSSGGPLVNLDGRVIGITTSIASEDGGYQGIGFAVPANYAARLLAQFREPQGQ